LNKNLTDTEVDATWVIANSRFQATNVAIWADSALLKFELYGSGSVLEPSAAPEGTKYILATGDLTAVGDFDEVITGDGYILYKLK
jgi:hypothetical protein